MTQIKLLRDHPEFIDEVAKRLTTEFGIAGSLNFYKGIAEHSLVENALPITFIALEEGDLQGIVGIWRADLLSRQDLYPWLSGLIVAPSCRGRGVGRALQSHALQYCKSMGYSRIYLYTDLAGYYEKSGWTQIDTGYEYVGEEFNIYRQDL